MERVGAIPNLPAAAVTGRILPLGGGWVMEPADSGHLLKLLAIGARVRITAEEAQSLRAGEVTPDAVAARHGLTLPPHPPGAAITVAFSDEAKRLVGTRPQDRDTAGPAGKPLPQGVIRPLPVPLLTAVLLAVIAILALALAI